ncbi:hypothetical protein PMIN04_004350 [Paraphaeosphaeria minitans]
MLKLRTYPGSKPSHKLDTESYNAVFTVWWARKVTVVAKTLPDTVNLGMTVPNEESTQDQNSCVATFFL